MTTLTEFTSVYPAHPPQRPPANPDELRLLTAEEGVQHMGLAPASNTVGTPPVRGTPSDAGRYLWVFDPRGVPYILEAAEVSPPLASGRVKHTNLTGGQPACCGGELWFDGPQARRLYVNGASGRYGPRTPQQLEDAVSVFRELGYEVFSFGWDPDTDRPERVFYGTNVP